MSRDVAGEKTMLSDNAMEAVHDLVKFMDEKGGGYDQWRVSVTAYPCDFAVDIILAKKVAAGEWTCRQTISHEAAREATVYLTRVVGVCGEIMDSETSRFIMLYKRVDETRDKH